MDVEDFLDQIDQIRKDEKQKKFDKKWWYKLGKVILWIGVIGGFIVGVSTHIIDGILGALINYLVLIGLGKLIIYIILKIEDKKKSKIQNKKGEERLKSKAKAKTWAEFFSMVYAFVIVATIVGVVSIVGLYTLTLITDIIHFSWKFVAIVVLLGGIFGVWQHKTN